MCGVFGLFGKEHAAALTQLGLYSLQHRGQESWGIVSIDSNGDPRAARSMGLISEATERTFSNDADIAIGHTRYSTAGSSTIENAQPVLARARAGNITLAHNGNLTNATELRHELEDEGAIFASTTDSEVIVHRIARASGAIPSERLAEALRGVEGAYSLVATSATRCSPRAIRADGVRSRWARSAMRRCSPRRRARSTSSARPTFATSSRARSSPSMTTARAQSFPFERKDGRAAASSSTCTSRVPTAASTAARSTAHAARSDGGSRARRPPPSADLVFGVPDSSNSAALGFAEEAKLPYELALIRNHYVGRTFIQPNNPGATRR